MAETERRFHEAEVEAILRRVFSRSGRDEGLSESELVDTARQMGVAPEVLLAAIDEHDVEVAVDAVRAQWMAERERARAQTLQVSSGVLLLLLGLNLALSPAVMWSAWMAVLVLGVWTAQGYLLRQGPDPAMLDEVRAWEQGRVEAARRQRVHAAAAAQRRDVDEALGAAGSALKQTLKLRMTAWLQSMNDQLRPAAHRPRGGMSEVGPAPTAEVAPTGRVRIHAVDPETAPRTQAAEVEAELEALRRKVARR